jgi:NifB/MoaA-like Fe-S oxidoreductase
MEFYEDLPQEDNGVGQARTQYEELRSALPRLIQAGQGQRRTATILTGTLAASWFERDLRALLDQIPWLELRVLGLENSLYGKGITVAGLLPGRDFVAAIRSLPEDAGVVLLPDTPINHENLFLDELSLDELHRVSPRPLRVASEGLIEALLELTSPTLSEQGT